MNEPIRLSIFCLGILFIMVATFIPSNSQARPSNENTTPKTQLAKIVNQITPGEWAILDAKRPPRLMHVYVGKRESGKPRYHHIAGWTDDAHWDSDKGQLFFMGYRQHLKFISYQEATNQWSTIDGPFGWQSKKNGAFTDERRTKYGHTYGGNAYDPESKTYFTVLAGHTYLYDVANSQWDRIRGGSKMSIEFFPGIGLLSHHKKPDKLKRFKISRLNLKTRKWELFAYAPFSGYHSLAKYNPFLEEMLIIGGNSTRSVIAIDKSGAVKQLKDTPFDTTIRHGRLMVDPATGHYLIIHKNQLFEFDSKTNRYLQVDSFNPPWSRYEMPVPASIPEHEVIMFFDKKTYLYKHQSNFPAN